MKAENETEAASIYRIADDPEAEWRYKLEQKDLALKSAKKRIRQLAVGLPMLLGGGSALVGEVLLRIYHKVLVWQIAQFTGETVLVIIALAVFIAGWINLAGEEI